MRTAWKTKKMSSTERLEKRLTEAINGKNIEKVSTFLDRLHRSGVNCGFAVEAAKRFLLSPRKERRRTK